MGKKLKDLKKGDKIWFVEPYYKGYEISIGSEPPKIYEGTIYNDTSKQGTLPYPDYCLVHYYCPGLNPNLLSTSEGGENEHGSNGHLFFTDYYECNNYVKDLAQKKLEYTEKKIETLSKHIKELKEILRLRL